MFFFLKSKEHKLRKWVNISLRNMYREILQVTNGLCPQHLLLLCDAHSCPVPHLAVPWPVLVNPELASSFCSLSYFSCRLSCKSPCPKENQKTDCTWVQTAPWSIKFLGYYSVTTVLFHWVCISLAPLLLICLKPLHSLSFKGYQLYSFSFLCFVWQPGLVAL